MHCWDGVGWGWHCSRCGWDPTALPASLGLLQCHRWPELGSWEAWQVRLLLTLGWQCQGSTCSRKTLMGCPGHTLQMIFVDHFQMWQRETEAQWRLWLATGYIKLNQTPELVGFLHLWAENGCFLEVGKKKAINCAHGCNPAHTKGFETQKHIWDLWTQGFASLHTPFRWLRWESEGQWFSDAALT